jgi:ribose 5-phosphate isomerase B
MIAIGCDGAGTLLKEAARAFLDARGMEYTDFGEAGDYPDIAETVARAVADGRCRLGILVCGTGIGMSMAANKVKGVRAAVCGDYYSAKYTRLHNDANVICLGARVLGAPLALELLDVFLSTPFDGERHAARVEKINRIGTDSCSDSGSDSC